VRSCSYRISEKYIQVYLKLQRWPEQRFHNGGDRGTDELKQCTLSLIDKLSMGIPIRGGAMSRKKTADFSGASQSQPT